MSGRVLRYQAYGSKHEAAFFGGKKDTKQINKTPAHIAQATRTGRQSRVMEEDWLAQLLLMRPQGLSEEMLFPN